ncbi:MAG TPA: hypothetical protein VF742_14920, partial [Terracidiphilus sp.]
MSRVRGLLLGVSLISVAHVLHPQTPARAFFARIYSDKCLDFTNATQAGGGPVVISACNYSATQQIVVQEINARHEVVLHAGQKVIGVHQPLVITTGTTTVLNLTAPTQKLQAPARQADQGITGVHQPTAVTTGTATFLNLTVPTLELQAPARPTDQAFQNQVFALDGDSIILASNRDLVAQAKDNRGTSGTSVIMGTRNLSDAEFWNFTAVTGADEDPTSGFIRVSSRDTLLNAITQVNQVASANNGAAWGS